VWGGELDIDADENPIACELAADCLASEIGTGRNSEDWLVGFASGLEDGLATDDVAVWDDGWDDGLDADAIGNLIAAELIEAGLGSLVKEFGFVGGSEWEITVGLEPLTLAERLLLKEDSETGCAGLVDSCVCDSAYDSLAGGGSVVVPGIGFIQDEKRKLIGFCDAAEANRDDSLKTENCFAVDGSISYDLFCMIGFRMSGDSGRFISRNVLYDPGGFAFRFGNGIGLSSWGLLVSSVFASTEALSVVVVLRALRFWILILSMSCSNTIVFGIVATAHMPIDCFE